VLVLYCPDPLIYQCQCECECYVSYMSFFPNILVHVNPNICNHVRLPIQISRSINPNHRPIAPPIINLNAPWRRIDSSVVNRNMAKPRPNSILSALSSVPGEAGHG